MTNETPNRSARAPHDGGHSGSGDELSSPLQARAAFFKNWDWQFIISINRGACERGRAQHGLNSEAGAACAQDWEALRVETLSFSEALDSLRAFHRRAPFLFFNGNSFATLGRELAIVLFHDLAPTRKREVSSAIAHYIAGVLDRESMAEIVESLCASADWKSGDRIKTLRGSTRGKILRMLADNRVVWQPDGSQSELIALPESLVRD